MTSQDHKQAVPPLKKPLLPACFLRWTEPPDATGDETLRIASWRRNITLQGKSFATFEEQVMPLLDGTRSVDAICEEVRHIFDRSALLASFATLAEQGILVEGEGRAATAAATHRKPQQGWLSEAAPEGQGAQARLQSTHVVLFGAGMHGAVVARALVAAGIGRLTIVDPSDVKATDPYFAGVFVAADIGKNRAACLVSTLQQHADATDLSYETTRPADPNDIMALISDATLVLCCLESGEQTLALNLNVACKAVGLPWMAASLEGSELLVGPGFFAHDTGPCYMCWRMREVAAAPNQGTRLALETHLGSVQADLSARRENLAMSADIVGGMLGAETLAWITGASMPNLAGQFIQINVPGLRQEKHTVLRNPGCPVCASIGAKA